jgi:hypothetical protein
MARLGFVVSQIREVEEARQKRLAPPLQLWAEFASDSPLEGSGFEPLVPLS